MNYNSVREILTDINYWRSILNLNSKTKHLTTEFHIKNMGICTEFCNDDICNFYLGDLVILCDHNGINYSSSNNYILYSLYYKQLKYTNTLYIDFFLNGDTYTKPVRIKKDESLYSKKVQDKIRTIVYEFLSAYKINVAIDGYRMDNIQYLNLEHKNKKGRK